MAISKAFVWGDGGAQLTPEEIARQREVEDALLQRGVDTSPVGSWAEGLARVANAAAGSFRRGRLLKAESENKAYDTEAFNKITTLLSGGVSSTPSARVPMTGGAAEGSAVDPAKIDMTGNQVYGDFINTVKQGYQLADGSTVKLDSPYALAAVAATGKAESGYSPANANRAWSDPSESGQPGTAGGIMSWRGPRLKALYDFAASQGEQPGTISPATQAKFFLQEDPNLVAALNNAKSIEEAQGLMNRAWAFKGYDRPGGEAARRMGLAAGFLPEFQGNGAPTQVASLDPSAGMPLSEAAAAIERTAPGSGTVAAPQGVARNALPPLPSTNVGAAPAVSGVSPQASRQPPQQVAQAAPAVTAPNGTAIPPEILQVLGDPRVSQRTRGIATLLLQQQQARQQLILEQELKQADPGYKADLRLKQLQADQIANPRMSPSEAANLDLNREKFTADTRANADRLALDKDKFAADRENNALTPDLKEYNAYVKGEQSAGRTPLSLLDYQLAVKKAGASSTVVNNGEGSKFYNTLDEQNAKTFATLSDGGIQARSRLAQINRLEGLMKNAPQGGSGAVKQWLGDIGVPTEGLSDIQAASALIERLVPQQRQPGSGPMSDADLAGFKRSLPRVINQPGGNQLIFQTLRGITDYEIKMGAISDRVANREITPSEARRQIQELHNPLEDYKISDGPTPNGGTTSTGIKWGVEQ